MSDTISVINEQGLVETIDIYSGKVIAVQESKGDLFKSRLELMTQVLIDGELVWIERGMSLDKYVSKAKWAYSEVIIDIICQKLLEGKRLGEICKQPGIPPYHILSAWRRKHSEADEKIRAARADYAELYREQVLEEAMSADEENVQTARLRMDALKWAAGVDNPDKYGAKTKVSHDVSGSVQLIVDTGIRRPEDIPIEAKSVEEVTDGKDHRQAQIVESQPSGSGNSTTSSGDGTPSASGAALVPVE